MAYRKIKKSGLLSLAEMAEAIGATYPTFYRHVREGKFRRPNKVCGGRIYYDAATAEIVRKQAELLKQLTAVE